MHDVSIKTYGIRALHTAYYCRPSTCMNLLCQPILKFYSIRKSNQAKKYKNDSLHKTVDALNQMKMKLREVK